MNINEYIKVDKNEKPLDRLALDGGYVSIFRTMCCIGDSLSSGEFESKDKDGNTSWWDMMDYSWGQYIARHAGIKVYNFSRGGMTAKEYMESFSIENNMWDERILESKAFTIALGVNDMFGQHQEIGSVKDVNLDDFSKNATTFAGYYAQIIQKIQSINPKAKIFLITMPKNTPEEDEIRIKCRNLYEDFTKMFKNTYLIDLYTYTPRIEGEFNDTFYLGGHMTPMGYVLASRIIESYIDYIIRHNPQDFKEVMWIGTDKQFYYDK